MRALRKKYYILKYKMWRARRTVSLYLSDKSRLFRRIRWAVLNRLQWRKRISWDVDNLWETLTAEYTENWQLQRDLDDALDEISILRADLYTAQDEIEELQGDMKTMLDAVADLEDSNEKVTLSAEELQETIETLLAAFDRYEAFDKAVEQDVLQ